MDIIHLYWLREILTDDHAGSDMIAMEASYEDGNVRTPHFFRVPEPDVPQARALYTAWGGVRGEGFRVGTTVRGPGIPFAPSIKLWREHDRPTN